MIHALILKEASLPIAPTTQHNNKATPGDSGGLYRRNTTAPDVTLYLRCGDIFSSAWMLTLKIGAIVWQGPHHVAVKSTTTNLFPAFFRALSKAGCRERRRSWFCFQTGMTHSFLLRFTDMGNDESMLCFNQSDWDFTKYLKEYLQKSHMAYDLKGVAQLLLSIWDTEIQLKYLSVKLHWKQNKHVGYYFIQINTTLINIWCNI